MALIFSSYFLDAMPILLALFAILYFYMTRNFNYWENQGVRYIRPVAFFGNIASVVLMRESIGCWLDRKYKETVGERFFGVYFVDKPALVVRDLELLKNVFVKDAHIFRDRSVAPREDVDPLLARGLFGVKGGKWRHMRVKLSPTFTSGKMKKMFYLVDECGKQLTTCLHQSTSSGEHVNVREIMSRYNTDVISSCAFGVNANALIDPDSKIKTMMKKMVQRDSFNDKLTSIVVFVVPFVVHLLKLKTFAKDIEDFVRKMFWDVVEHRKKTGVVRNDFVDLLMKIMDEGEVRNEDANDVEETKRDNSLSSTEYSAKDGIKFEMTDDDYVAQAFGFLFAGFETASSVLNFSLYELALNPDIQDKLRDEITTTLDKHEGKLSYGVMNDMAYLDMVVAETLRKYPTLAFLDRTCSADYQIPGSQVIIEKGTQVMIPVLGIHSDPEIYPDPEVFDPQRFSAENKSKRSQFAHIPFGEGPRICIGMRFGQMQVKTALIYVLSTFQVRPCAETPKRPLRYKPTALTHTPQQDIVLAFTKL